MPEIEIRIKVSFCLRCHHLWQRHKGNGRPLTCPNCNSPYWDSIPKRKVKGTSERNPPPLKFHGEEVLESNFDKIYGKESHKKNIYDKK
jgi:hypothetical protein